MQLPSNVPLITFLSISPSSLHPLFAPINSPTRTAPTAALVRRILPASQQVHPGTLDPRRIALPSRPGLHLLPLLGWNPQLCRKELCHVCFYSFYFSPCIISFLSLSPIHPCYRCTLLPYFSSEGLQFTLTGTLKRSFSLFISSRSFCLFNIGWR